MATSSYTPMYVSSSEFDKFANLDEIFDQLSAAKLEKAGISHSNSFIVFSSLRALGIYDAEGRLLHRKDLEDIKSKDKKIKQEGYKRIVNRAYKDLLAKYSADKVTYEDAAKHFEEKGAVTSVSKKAARLYIWLLEQAGLRNTQTVIVRTKKEDALASQTTSHSERLLNLVLAQIESKQASGISTEELLTLVEKSEALIEKINHENARNGSREGG